MWQQILDLPVIVQGALGSALFWLAFEVSKRTFNFLIDIFGRLSKNTHKNLLAYDALFHARCMYEVGSIEYTATYVKSIFSALQKLLYALIYICLGLIASHWFGELALIAYVISVFNLFIALRAITSVWGTSLSKAEHSKEYSKLMKLIKEIPSKEKSGAD